MLTRSTDNASPTARVSAPKASCNVPWRTRSLFITELSIDC